MKTTWKKSGLPWIYDLDLELIWLPKPPMTQWECAKCENGEGDIICLNRPYLSPQ